MLYQSLRIALAVLGACLVYLGLFVYESEERRIENWLDELWVHIDDAARAAQTVHLAFLREIASVVLVNIDRAFPRQLLSWSTGIRVFAFTVTAFLLFVAIGAGVGGALSPVALLGVWVGSGFVAFAAMSSRILRFVAKVVLVAYGLVLIGSVSLSIKTAETWIDPRIFVFVMPGALFNSLTIGFSRTALTSMVKARSAVRASAALVMMSLPIIVLVIAIAGLATFDIMTAMELAGGGSYPVELVISGGMLFFPSGCGAFIALAGVLLAFTLSLHRLMWPLASRGVYALGRFGIFRHRALLISTGITLIGVQFPRVANLLRLARGGG